MNPNACPTPPQPLNPTRPYSAPLGKRNPNACPTPPQPHSTPRPYPAPLGPTRPHSARLASRPRVATPSEVLVIVGGGPTRPHPLGSTGPHSALPGPTRPYSASDPYPAPLALAFHSLGPSNWKRLEIEGFQFRRERMMSDWKLKCRRDLACQGPWP